jgi:hypothetical protein
VDNEKHLSEDRLKRESRIEIPITSKPGSPHKAGTEQDLVVTNNESRLGTESGLKRNVSTNQFQKRDPENLMMNNENGSFFNTENKNLAEALKHSRKQIVDNSGQNLSNFIESLSKPRQQTMVIQSKKMGHANLPDS